MVNAKPPATSISTSAVPKVNNPIRLWSVLASQPTIEPGCACRPGSTSRGTGRSAVAVMPPSHPCPSAVQELLVLLRGHHLHVEVHGHVVGSAVLRAAAPPPSLLRKDHPQRVDVIRVGVALGREVGQPEGVHHIR